jgi:hypothetical protein
MKCIVKLAKARNQEQFANDTLAKKWAKNPKKAWDAVQALSSGCYHHHAQATAMKMKLPPKTTRKMQTSLTRTSSESSMETHHTSTSR